MTRRLGIAMVALAGLAGANRPPPRQAPPGPGGDYRARPTRPCLVGQWAETL